MSSIHLSPTSASDLELFKSTGINAAQKAGDALLSLFNRTAILAEKADGDWVTQADLTSDQIIRDIIQSSQPGVRIVSEEDALQIPDRTGPTWVIDPLDGTYNFILGIPVFAIALTLVIDGRPVLAIVNQPFTRQLYVAQEGLGATLNAEKLSISPKEKSQLGTICYVLGYANRKEAAADNLLLELRHHSKRVLELWAPSLSWCLVAQEKVDSVICISPSEFDSMGSVLILKEAGGVVTSLESNISASKQASSLQSILVGSTHCAIHQIILEIVQGCIGV